MAVATTPGLDAYAVAAKTAGCPRDQLERFVRAGIVLQPKQLAASAAARECDLEGGPTRVYMGGARGPGKSFWAISQVVIDDCQRFPFLKALILRKVGKAARESFEDLRGAALRGVAHKYSQGVCTLPNGARVIIGHFHNESDIDNYIGVEYDLILCEEDTTLTTSKKRDIGTCLRTSKRGWRPRMYGTTNPGGVGHARFKKEVVEPWRKKQQTTSRFIPATVYDNRFTNPEYLAELEALTGWKRKAWLEGSWDISAGQYFTNFRHETHVIPATMYPEIPESWPVWAALDYGFTHYTCVHLMTEGDGVVYVIDEHAERGWLAPRHATAIKAMLVRNGMDLSRLRSFVAGADCFSKRHDGTTIAQQYRNEGIVLRPANDERINGAAEILKRLGDVDSDPPIPASLFIFEKCARLVDCLPALEHDPHRPEDVLKVDVDEDGNGGDDPYDSGRYGIMAAHKRRNILI